MSLRYESSRLRFHTKREKSDRGGRSRRHGWLDTADTAAAAAVSRREMFFPGNIDTHS